MLEIIASDLFTKDVILEHVHLIKLQVVIIAHLARIPEYTTQKHVCRVKKAGTLCAVLCNANLLVAETKQTNKQMYVILTAGAFHKIIVHVEMDIETIYARIRPLLAVRNYSNSNISR